MSEKYQLVATRQSKLLDLINTNSSADVRQLSDFFDVSEATIRRDLTTMEAKGLLARTHGGAVDITLVGQEIPHAKRAVANITEKLQIGEEAARLLNGDETVFIDAGTTAVQAATILAKKSGCTFVTSSLGVANVLAAQGHQKFYLTGGYYHTINEALGSTLALNALNGLTFDLALLCASSVDVERRAISMVLEPYCQVQKKIISVSRRAFVIADHTKFKCSAFSISASFDEIDGIITNRKLDQSMRNKCAEAGLELILS